MRKERLDVEKSVRGDAVIERFLEALPPGKGIREIYLFGSRCRDDWRPDSDYDLLLVVEKKERGTISMLYDIVMEILLDTGRLVSLKIFTVSDFKRLRAIPTPFMEQILKEGIRLERHP
ncbi:MAG: nucleotidyltransferase domain-containing protein [Candidatus Sulfobium sp.]|jgi:predicted nucleotidyltransferase